MLLANAAQADDVEPSAGPIAFRIEPQSLDKALVEFSAASGQPVAVDGKLSTGVRSPGVSGSYTPRQALDKLLAGTGVAARVGRNGTVTLEKAKAAEPQSMAVALPKVTVSDTAAYDPTDPYDQNYAVPDSFAATKTDTPIMKTPVSIRVVPKALMDDQQAFDVKEAVRNVSGVQFSPQVSGYENFVIRGFDAGGSIYRNGLRQAAFAEEVANLQRIEVLKGPAAVLYGRIEPGGLVNMVTSRPLDHPYYSLQQQFGSYDFYRTTVDATGPIDDDKSLLYRFNLAYCNNESYRDFYSFERIFLAPSLTWRISDQTQAHLLFEYQHDDFPADYGFPAIGKRPASFPINRWLGDPVAYSFQNSQRIYLDWSHAFNENWKLTNRFMTSLADYRQRDISTRGQPADGRTYQRSLWDVFQNRDIYSTNLDLTGHFNTWDAVHTVLIGFDYYLFEQDASGHCCNAVTPIDALNPVYGDIDHAVLDSFPENFYFANSREWAGIYFQDQIKLWDKLHILGGGRYDWATAGSASSAASLAAADELRRSREIQSERFNPRVGLVYQPWSWLALYGNYTESLGANNGRT